ncbi:MAG TPA: hypothetical protein VN612_06510 [Acidobacteriaceae bacterium]|nr:hypothetical protein [Acidobacteriaceae bacterium]
MLLSMGSVSQAAVSRKVVLMSSEESRELDRLASRDDVSSGEILRRGIRAYAQGAPEPEQETLAALVREMNFALDNALASVRSTRREVRHNLAKIRRLRGTKA